MCYTTKYCKVPGTPVLFLLIIVSGVDRMMGMPPNKCIFRIAFALAVILAAAGPTLAEERLALLIGKTNTAIRWGH
jgi:hypothetical protein